MNIREAETNDIPRIIEMGSKFLKMGPYNQFISDSPETTSKLALRLLNMPNAKVLVGEENDHVEGVFAFITFDHYYSGEPVAGEMIWYVEPEARHHNMALELLWAAEKMASIMGAKKMQLTAPSDEIAAMYGKLRGFVKVETAFQRDISCR